MAKEIEVYKLVEKTQENILEAVKVMPRAGTDLRAFTFKQLSDIANKAFQLGRQSAQDDAIDCFAKMIRQNDEPEYPETEDE